MVQPLWSVCGPLFKIVEITYHPALQPAGHGQRGAGAGHGRSAGVRAAVRDRRLPPGVPHQAHTGQGTIVLSQSFYYSLFSCIEIILRNPPS